MTPLERLDLLAELTPSWNGGNEPAISPDCIRHAREILTRPEVVAARPWLSTFVAPMFSGRVRIEWIVGDRGAEIEVNADGSLHVDAYPDPCGDAYPGLELASSHGELFAALLQWLLQHGEWVFPVEDDGLKRLRYDCCVCATVVRVIVSLEPVRLPEHCGKPMKPEARPGIPQPY